MNSFLNAKWDYKEPDPNLVNTLCEETGLSDLLIRILINRKFSNVNDINQILNTKLKTSILSSDLFLDMDKAVERIAQAILNKENVTVFGDYDVDGITSTCLLIKSLRQFGLNLSYYIPSRLKDGYGLSKAFIERTANENIQLIIVTDSGIGAIEEVEIANKYGIDVVIFDHHAQLLDKIPNAIAVVDPNRIDQKEIKYSYIKSLCAAGVVFVFLVYLMQYFHKTCNVKTQCVKTQRVKTQSVDVMNLIDLAALGTIGDLVDLVGINRGFVKYLLHTQKVCLGLQELMNIFKISKIKGVEDIAYYISPALNAAGRMGQAEKAVELLLSTSEEDAKQHASELVMLNTRRKEIEKETFKEALKLAEENSSDKGICVYGDNWHEGVIGIISGKLREKYQKPVFVISFNNGDIGRGSVRSMPGLHAGQLINKAVESGILESGGGHELAGGLAIKRENINKFTDFLEQEIPNELVSSLDIDYVLTSRSNLHNISDEINKLMPFGSGLPKPTFAMKHCRILEAKFINDNFHLRFVLSDECNRGRVKAILFHSYMNKQFEQAILAHHHSLFDVIGNISYNQNYGSSFIIKDIKFSEDLN